jgi:hypothetical protein
VCLFMTKKLGRKPPRPLLLRDDFKTSAHYKAYLFRKKRKQWCAYRKEMDFLNKDARKIWQEEKEFVLRLRARRAHGA